ncbi:MAG: hypothetical protein HYT63_02335 [Candidatus Yanofskybacteria bacterium]|nr:hypothetical protein [Candidatus Yanofskybacteria bacterium]
MSNSNPFTLADSNMFALAELARIKLWIDKRFVKESEEMRETILSYLYDLVRRAPRDEFLKSRIYTSFNIRDAKGGLWAVRVDWYSDFCEWFADAYPISFPREWYSGGDFV